MGAARIGKIKMKAGGAEVRIIDRASPNPLGENWRGKLIEHARQVAGYDDGNSALVGFFVIGIFTDGAHSVGFRWDKDRSPVPARMMPAYVAEIVREELVTPCSFQS